MTAKAILFTQCLQNDFVKPLDRYDPMPNHLHIGFEESERLMGEEPDKGPIALTMQWAYEQPEDELAIIHIRDWHDPQDEFQQEHLRQFGEHCVAGTPGAEFAFPIPNSDRKVEIIDSPGISDFIGTNLDEILAAYPEEHTRIGLMGVWTEAKITYLAYDIRSRYPEIDIAICSALTASSSRAHHFMALEQLKRLLGVQIFSSIGAFTDFLTGSGAEIQLATPSHADLPHINLAENTELSETDKEIVRYLFRDCKDVSLKKLGGGFSGNLVLSSESVDIYGHQQVPHVVKLGEQQTIGQERASFERVEDVLGNSAPHISEFADLKGRGGLKYRYAAMGSGFSTTFKKVYESGAPQEQIQRYLKTVFGDQLGRFYKAATLERSNLLEHYRFSPSFAAGVRRSVESILGRPAVGETLTLPNGRTLPNLCTFYEEDLETLLPLGTRSNFFSYVHGDLNGANIVIDGQDNVWLIDFFHTGRSHVLRDLIKLENDLLYIFTKIESPAELEDALKLSDILLDIHDLAAPLPPVKETELRQPAIVRAYETVRFLRSFYPPLIKLDRNPLQMLIGQLRYAAHTMSFDESNEYQKAWALYASGHLAAQITRTLRMSQALRVDFLDELDTSPGQLGLTILPGRRDLSRSLEEDLESLEDDGISHIVCLVPQKELEFYGVGNLLAEYAAKGFDAYHLPIPDQGVCTPAEMDAVLDWLESPLADGKKVMIHCVGGLGRSGLLAGSYLKRKGMNGEAAIKAVRAARSPRAIESLAQEEFIRQYAPKNNLLGLC